MKKLMMIAVLIAFVAIPAEVSAQGWLGRLGGSVVDRAKSKAESKVDQAVDKAVDKAEDEAVDAVKGKKGKNKKSKNEESDEPQVEEADDNPTTATASDFKRGSVIMFQDDVTAEQVGEFPSKWDLFQGTVETKTLGGVKAINLTDNAQVQPLIKEQGAYLPEEFTIEYDFYYWPTSKVPGNDDYIGLNDMKLILAVTKDRSEFPQTGGDGGDLTAFVLTHGVCSSSEHTYYFNGDKKGDFVYSFKKGWNHVALSFNKRALKVYFNDKRVVNLPRVNQPTWMCFQVPFDYHNLTFIRNVVIAKGAVALYDRNAQSMTAVEKAIAETGKFVTNNILFETGKATLKPESMAEIQKVADYMKKNPQARFEVQGHTDNQGSDKINDPLSQQRAESVVKALEGLGVDGFNLRAVGKGSHVPVADNSTADGRAKNRRVEFIKK
jgi:outer membrane protein OmpA-like peptidoglycan-associated protein